MNRILHQSKYRTCELKSVSVFAILLVCYLPSVYNATRLKIDKIYMYTYIALFL